VDRETVDAVAWLIRCCVGVLLVILGSVSAPVYGAPVFPLLFFVGGGVTEGWLEWLDART
jgi:hypothetical protein